MESQYRWRPILLFLTVEELGCVRETGCFHRAMVRVVLRPMLHRSEQEAHQMRVMIYGVDAAVAHARHRLRLQ